jgi:hypothetical protein
MKMEKRKTKIGPRLAVLAVLLLLAAPAQAQNITTVSATVLDPNGIPYAGGTVTFLLVNSSGVASFASTPILGAGGGTISGVAGPFTLSAAGVLSANLPSNAVILPAGRM